MSAAGKVMGPWFMDDQMRPVYGSVHLQRQLELARAWLAQERVPVSVRCGMAERLFLASQKRST